MPASSLKGNWREDAMKLAWKSCRKCASVSTCSFLLVVQSLLILCKRSTVLLGIWAPQPLVSIRSLAMKNKKKLAPEVCHTFAKHSYLVHDVTDTVCWTQNGGIHGRVFATFKIRVSINNQDKYIQWKCEYIHRDWQAERPTRERKWKLTGRQTVERERFRPNRMHVQVFTQFISHPFPSNFQALMGTEIVG